MAFVTLRIQHHLSVGLLVAFFFSSLAILALPVYAQEGQSSSEQAVVEFDGEVLGDADGRFSVSGNVRFTYEGIEVRSDTMVVEAGGDVIHFFDNVVVATPDEEMRGDRFVYDVPAGTSVLFQPRGELEMESVEGPVYYRGETLSVDAERVVLTGAMFTTCSCETPGYYLAGSRMEIIPNVSMTIYNVRFVESGITLFYWPKLTLPLYTAARPPFQLPQIGHDALDGWYVKSSLPYEGLGAGGLVLLDWMQYKGVGVGVSHFYRDDPDGMGQLHAYALFNRSTNSIDPTLGWSGRSSSERWNTSWDLEHSAKGPADGRSNLSQGSLSLRNTRPDGQITVNASGSHELRPTGTPRTSVSGSFRLSQQLVGRTRLSLSGDSLVRQGYGVDRRLYSYSVDLSNNAGPITWRIAANERFNPELAKEESSTAPEWRSTGSRPEITLGATPAPTVFGRIVPLTFEVGWGSYSESRANSSVQDTRATVLAQLRTMTFPVGSKLSLTAAGYLRGYRYGSGMDRILVSSTYTATYRPVQQIQLRGSYEYLEQIGHTPFRFDRATPHERIRGSLQYTGSAVNLTLSSGFNLLTQQPENLNINAQVRPVEQVSLRAQGVYSLRDQRPVSLVGTVELGDGEGISLKLGGKYSFSTAMFDRVDGALSLDIGSWKIGYEAIYNAKKEEFERGAFTLLRDLDCRLIGISYDQTKGQVWLEYRITAIPSMGLRVGSDQGGLLFDLEGWEELLQ